MLQFSKRCFSSLASGIDQLGVEVPVNRTDTGTQYEDLTGATHTVPDVVSSTRQTADSSCQYETSTTDVGSQHSVSYTNAASQVTPKAPLVHSSTQHIPQVIDRMCQSDSIVKEQSSQYDLIITREVSSQSLVDSKHLATQYEPMPMRNCSTTTDLRFNVRQGMPCLDQNGAVSLAVVGNKVDATTATNKLIMADQSTFTTPIKCIHQSTGTELIRKMNVALDPVPPLVAHQLSQTNVPLMSHISTNTPATPKCKDAGTATALCIKFEQSSQTVAQKLKSRGIAVRPSIAELGINVKPDSVAVSTNTSGESVSERETQTVLLGHSNKSTATVTPDRASRGVTAHVPGVNCHTSTADLVGANTMATQTQQDCNSIAVGTEATKHGEDKSTSTTVLCSAIACGSDMPISHFTSVGVGAVTAPVVRNVGVNATQSKSDSWTNPITQPVSSKACGTERIKRRNVGLYVRPLSMDNSSMTQAVSTAEIASGPEGPSLQDNKMCDTTGLVTCHDAHSSTERKSNHCYHYN